MPSSSSTKSGWSRNVLLIICVFFLVTCLLFISSFLLLNKPNESSPMFLPPYQSFKSPEEVIPNIHELLLESSSSSQESPPPSKSSEKELLDSFCSNPKYFPCDRRDSRRNNNFVFDRVSRLSIIDLLGFYREEVILRGKPSQETIFKPANVQREPLICLLAMMHTENCNTEVETFESCVLRIGLPAAEKVLPRICLSSLFWKMWKDRRLLPRIDNKNTTNNSTTSHFIIKHGVIPTSTVRTSPSEKSSFKPFSDTLPTPYGPPLRCGPSSMSSSSSSSSSLHPIGFGVPKNTIVDSIDPTVKGFDFSPLVPGQHLSISDRGYRLGVREEALYRQLYTSSFFAFTNNRGGWVSERTYEILASGTVPFFPEISLSPKYTHTDLPKRLLRKVLTLSGVRHLGGEFPQDYDATITAQDVRMMTMLREQHKKKTSIKKHHSTYDDASFYWDERSMISSSSGEKKRGNMKHKNRVFRFPGPANRSQFMKPISPAHIAFLKPGTVEAKKFDLVGYYRILHALHDYTKKYLSCSSMVMSIIERMGLRTKKVEDDIRLRNKRFLLVTRFQYDYLNTAIINGFTELGIPLTIVGDSSHKDFLFRMKEVSPLDNFTEIQRGESLAKKPPIYGAGYSFMARNYEPELGDVEFISSKDDPQLIKRLSSQHQNQDDEEEASNEFIGAIYSYVHPERMLVAPYLQTLLRNKNFFSGERAKTLAKYWDRKTEEYRKRHGDNFAIDDEKMQLKILRDALYQSDLPPVKDGEVTKIAFLDHDDRLFLGVKEYRKLSRIGRLFVREIDEKRSCSF